ncbi:hypothetical protein [Paraburkholderia unamae]|uniref:Holin n=1 Tax=Paraburkholderia unamae TaxID=219649 RepID=A0ABX5KHW9_9BURK|nr:hypothetical protein [Paraburkholderia unamae]PVX80039.1 hypothetical protein C7402_112226 [Paraburkholderia unamae]
MQFTLDGTTIITAIVAALWAVALAGCSIWVKRVQSDNREAREAIAGLARDLASFREAVAMKYASRDEVKDEREETRKLFEQIDAKINQMQAYLMKAKTS